MLINIKEPIQAQMIKLKISPSKERGEERERINYRTNPRDSVSKLQELQRKERKQQEEIIYEVIPERFPELDNVFRDRKVPECPGQTCIYTQVCHLQCPAMPGKDDSHTER